jgi:hypothetical protein
MAWRIAANIARLRELLRRVTKKSRGGFTFSAISLRVERSLKASRA